MSGNVLDLEGARLAELVELNEQIEEVRRIAREDPQLFFVPNRPQSAFFWSDCYARGFFGGNKSGKLQPISAHVFTPDGLAEIGDLEIGDRVFSGTGQETEIIAVRPQGKKAIYEFRFDDGATARAGLEHNWLVKVPVARFRKLHPDYGKWDVRTTEDLLVGYAPDTEPTRRVCIPAPGPLDFPGVDLPIDPYLLGVLLGDGSISTGNCAVTTADPEILLECRLPETCLFKRASRYGYKIASYERTAKGYGKNVLMDKLRELDLYGKRSWEKAVPEIYLRSLPDDRLSVLQGLMDTDGTVCKRGMATFTSTSEDLARHVQWLVRSLGGKASISERSTSGRLAYNVSVRLVDFPVFRLARKVERLPEAYRTTDRVLHSIERVEDEESVCIEVACPSKTYITDDFVVTHNSTAGICEDDAFCRGERCWYPEGHVRRKIPFEPPVRGLVFAEKWDVVQDIHVRMLRKWTRPGEIKERTSQGNVVKIEYVSGPGKGSSINFGTYREDPETHEGKDWDFVHFDEPPPYALFHPVTRGLIVSGGMWWLTATLLSEAWLWDELYLRAEAGDPDYFAVIGSIYDNIFDPKTGAGALDTKFIQRFARTLDDTSRDVRLFGKPKHLQGRIFRAFKSERPWVVEPFELPTDWPAIRAFDPHQGKPMAGVWGRVTPQNRIVITDDLHDPDLPRSMEALRARVGMIEGARNHKIALSLMDSAGGAQDPNGYSVFDHFRKHGIPCRPAKKANKLARVLLTAQKFEVDPYTGLPEIVVFSTCERLIYELLRYTHPEYRNRQGAGRWKDLREGREKVDDECIDSLLYLVAEEPRYELLSGAFTQNEAGHAPTVYAEPYGDGEMVTATGTYGEGEEDFGEGGFVDAAHGQY